MPGTLYVVATPIGNLEDVTLRALRVLREVAIVAAEDTRRTAGLLAHYAIPARLRSFHRHNEHERGPELLARLRAGESVALVTDAGTPLVADPGSGLVRAAREAGIRVEAIPGPSALLAALVSAGLPAETFTFLGFPPHRAVERRAWARALGAEPRTTVFFEAPHRVEATLHDLAATLPDRTMAVARELTKIHEEILVGTAAQLLARLGPGRGEFTLVVGPPAPDTGPAVTPPSDEGLWREFCSLTTDDGLTRREAVAALARRYSRPAREIYAALERGKAGPPSTG
jgi:16S rRNA (cytidine1402-2'-O)-methyltransferase